MGKQWKQWQTLFFWPPKSCQMVTVAMKFRHLFLGRKTMTHLDSILKRRDITFVNKGLPSHGYGFSSSHVWLWELDYEESWVLKNWCFLTVLEKTLESPLGSRRSNQFILKEISPEYSLEGLMLKLKFLYFGHLMRRTDSFEKTLSWERLKAGGEGDDRGWDGWMASLTQWTWVWVSSVSWWWTGRPSMLQSMPSQRVRHDWATELKHMN